MVDEKFEEGVGFVELRLYQFWGVSEGFLVTVSSCFDGGVRWCHMCGWKERFEELLIHEVWWTCEDGEDDELDDWR